MTEKSLILMYCTHKDKFSNAVKDSFLNSGESVFLLKCPGLLMYMATNQRAESNHASIKHNCKHHTALN